MKEEWRDIKGYEGRYQVSNLGRVKSLNYRRTNREKILNLGYSHNKYLLVSLGSNPRKTFRVHRLVAEAFIPNPNNYKEVNHKDEDKTNNHVSNLEWCIHKYNMNYGTRTQRASEKISQNHADFSDSKHPRARKVLCITTGKKFNCVKEAAEYYHINRVSISKCCKEKYRYAGTHPVAGDELVWKYID